jgi:hypothetical protein
MNRGASCRSRNTGPNVGHVDRGNSGPGRKWDFFSLRRRAGEPRTKEQEVTEMELDIEIVEDGQVLLHHPST